MGESAHVVFIKMIIDYFGEYPNKTKAKIVATYVTKNVREEQLSDLFNKLIRTYPSQYKSPPDVRAINEALGRDVEEMARLDSFIDTIAAPVKRVSIGSSAVLQIEESANDECP
jgi:hypothetical protein